MIFDHPMISQRYFFPRAAPVEDAVTVEAADGSSLACRLAKPHSGARTVVYFHGNGEVVADLVPEMEEAFLALGVNVLLAEYRGYGGSTGTPALAAMLDDVDAILRAAGETDDRLVLFGRSVGSIFAIEAASRHPAVAGLVLESGIADVLERVLLRVTPEELGVSQDALEAAAAERFDHRGKLGAYPGPVLLLHTEHDGLVDVSHGRRNHLWAGQEKARLKVFARGDHNSILFANWDEYWAEVRAFIEGLPD